MTGPLSLLRRGWAVLQLGATMAGQILPAQAQPHPLDTSGLDAREAAR